MSRLMNFIVSGFCALGLLLTGTHHNLPNDFDLTKTFTFFNQCQGPCSPLHNFISYNCEDDCLKNHTQESDITCTNYQAIPNTSSGEHYRNSNHQNHSCHNLPKPNKLALHDQSSFILTFRKLE